VTALAICEPARELLATSLILLRLRSGQWSSVPGANVASTGGETAAIAVSAGGGHALQASVCPGPSQRVGPAWLVPLAAGAVARVEYLRYNCPDQVAAQTTPFLAGFDETGETVVLVQHAPPGGMAQYTEFAAAGPLRSTLTHRTLPMLDGDSLLLNLAPDARSFLLVRSGRQLEWWRFDGTRVAILEVPSRFVSALGSAGLAVAGANAVRFCDASGQVLSAELEGEASSIAVSSDPLKVAVGMDNGRVLVFSAARYQ
jgi:hypothetical protein